MGLIRRLVVIALLGAAVLMAYNYMNGQGFVLRAPTTIVPGSGPVLERSEELAGEATEKAKEAAGRIGEAVAEGGLSAKILSKMALDDVVKARNIGVSTSGTVVTLTGTVASEIERERAVRLAKETEGVTEIVDKLEMKQP